MSRRCTMRPSGWYFTMMSPNSFSVESLPCALMRSSNAAPVSSGGLLRLPAATCLFCSCNAEITCMGERLTAESLSGSSQMRMLYSFDPNVVNSLTPYTRESLSCNCVIA